jgi:hypothetical protein
MNSQTPENSAQPQPAHDEQSLWRAAGKPLKDTDPESHDLTGESERLRAAWMKYDPQVLDRYLVTDVEGMILRYWTGILLLMLKILE